MIRKLRRKFVSINMLIVVLMLFVILAMTVNMTRNSLEQESLDALRASLSSDKKDHPPEEKSQKPNEAPPPPTDSSEPTESRPTTQKPYTTPHKDGKDTRDRAHMPTFTLTISDTGTLIAKGSDFYDLTDPVYLETLMTSAKARGTEHGILWGPSLRFLRADPQGTVYSFVDISSERSTLWNLFLDCLLIGATAFIAFLLLSILLARWAIRPVETAWTQQQQFVADASHELKTPLTVIMTEAELLADPETKEDIRKQCANNILETSRRMRFLTEEMLTLARAENAQQELLEANCPLSELCEDSILNFEPLFFEKNLELQACIDEGITVKGNEAQLRQLCDILLDNAQKYSLPGTTVLTLRKQSHKLCEITLSNPADPMSKEDLEHLYDRFYRVDKARTANGSYGLGLSIAHSIIRRHSGTIQAEQQDGILTFRIRLPIVS